MSKTIKCLVLDGFHKGHMVVLGEPLNQLTLLKPRAITVDDCCDGSIVGADNDIKKSYIMAGYSVDRTMAFYSTDGSMESLLKRDWIAVESGIRWHEQPIYVGIHDPRAVVDYSTVADLNEVQPNE